MRKIFLSIMLLPSLLSAQTYHIDGFIKDSFTKEDIDSVKVTMMTMDSVVVESFYGNKYGWWQVYRDISAPGKYIMKFEHDGYYTTYKNVNFKYQKYRLTGDSFGEVLMRKIKMKKEVTLDEVVVSATKIKMVMRGDTIVYNADAFQLSSGSMLDKLVMMLPGAQLNHDGEIYVNGQKVESLLVNGEDFFNGDPKVALDNLPAYMVDKIKVYRKLDDRIFTPAELRNIQKSSLPLVLDVGLKREYSISWVGNAVAGAGTGKHFDLRLFAMRFTPNSHLAVVGNANDVRGDSYYDANGNWQNPYGNSGHITTQEIKIDGLLQNTEKTWKLSDYLSVKKQKREDVSLSSGTTFVGDNMYSRHARHSTNRDLRLRFNGKNSYVPSKKFSLDFVPNITYYHYNNNAADRSADFNRELAEHYMGEALDSLFGYGAGYEYRKILISSLERLYNGKGDELMTDGKVSGSARFREDRLNFHVSGNYSDKSNHSLTDYRRLETGDEMTRYSDRPQRSFKYETSLSYQYFLDFPKFTMYIIPEYNYAQSYSSDCRNYYKLDNSSASLWDIDALGSNKDSIIGFIDRANSYDSRLWNRTNTAALELYMYSKRDDYLNISMTPRIQFRNLYDRIEYYRAGTDTTIRRTRWFAEPSLELRIDENNQKGLEYHWKLNYSLTHSAPSLLYSVRYRDDATPLVVRESGSNLSAMHQHSAVLSYSRSLIKKRRFLTASLTYTLWENMVCQAMSYDMSSGVYTYRPDVISGNWNIEGNVRYETPLDKAKSWKFTTQSRISFRNSRDYLNTSGSAAPSVNSVGRLLASERFDVNWHRKLYSVNFTANLTLNHSESARFQTLNAIDYDYGVRGQIPLPAGFEAYAEMRMYSRAGYSDDNYNTNQLIANIKLAKSLFKGKIRAELEVFDLFDKMSGYSYFINAQMQQETYRNLLRRYAMLSLTYKFNQKKKHSR